MDRHVRPDAPGRIHMAVRSCGVRDSRLRGSDAGVDHWLRFATRAANPLVNDQDRIPPSYAAAPFPPPSFKELAQPANEPPHAARTTLRRTGAPSVALLLVGAVWNAKICFSICPPPSGRIHRCGR
jgi:hypothetical protein